MSFKKFGQNDVVVNTIKAHPSCEFFIFDGRVYYNSIPNQTGSFSSNVLNVPPGHTSLYEYNIDRATDTNPFIFPFVYKNSDKVYFKTTTKEAYNLLDPGATITSSAYPLSASITREYIVTAGQRSHLINTGSGELELSGGAPTHRKFYALKNRLDFYGTLSEHYKVSSSYGDKNTQNINLLSIPSIFFGSKIEAGSVSLKWYLTGSLIGELKDEKQNG